MTTEMTMLAWAVLFGIVQVLLAGGMSTQQRGGLSWGMGNRESAPPLTGAAGRAARASANYLETFPFFAAAALAVVLTKHNNGHTAFGAQLYFWARLAYFPIYVIGIPYIRTLVYLVAVWGIVQMVEPLL